VDDAYFQFAIGLHVLQDTTSPAHGGFQPWSDHETKNQIISHVSKELFYPGGELVRRFVYCRELDSGSIDEDHKVASFDVTDTMPLAVLFTPALYSCQFARKSSNLTRLLLLPVLGS
jgi:hypothetical protein